MGEGISFSITYVGGGVGEYDSTDEARDFDNPSYV